MQRKFGKLEVGYWGSGFEKQNLQKKTRCTQGYTNIGNKDLGIL